MAGWGEEFLCPELTGRIETGIKEHPWQAHVFFSLSLCDLIESDRIPLVQDAKAGQTLITVLDPKSQHSCSVLAYS